MAIMRVLLGYDIGGRTGANVFYHNQTEAGSTVALDDFEDIALEYANQWGYEIADAVSDSVTLVEVAVNTVDGSGMGNWSGSYPGGNSNVCSPPQVAYLMKKKITGQSRGGRTYMPGVPEVGVDEYGNVAAGTIADNASRWNAFLAAVNTNVGGFQCIFHAGALGSLAYPAVESYSCDAKVATMRNRLRG
uniref:Uncharacterized protein n=1 Tax=uncultured prokaryote TaxID=198431 RepID=A0A0H5Q834_9ZZZZ|nr:hypothetical protein [uncultured prokaryote]